MVVVASIGQSALSGQMRGSCLTRTQMGAGGYKALSVAGERPVTDSVFAHRTEGLPDH